jgi:hypothetical protein
VAGLLYNTEFDLVVAPIRFWGEIPPELRFCLDEVCCKVLTQVGEGSTDLSGVEGRDSDGYLLRRHEVVRSFKGALDEADTRRLARAWKSGFFHWRLAGRTAKVPPETLLASSRRTRNVRGRCSRSGNCDQCPKVVDHGGEVISTALGLEGLKVLTAIQHGD